MTQRLWLTEPLRRTAIATVTAKRGASFALDRSLFAPTSHAHRHPQPADQGVVWIEGGEKRRLVAVHERAGELWHEVRGAVPGVGSRLQCHLDQARRDLASRAHTALHLVLAAAQRASSPALASDPTVKGGGTFRLDFATTVAPASLAAWLAQANEWVRLGRAVTVEHWPRGDEAKVLDAQRFDPPDPYPGPPTSLDSVRIAGICAYPCDGTHAQRTSQVGRIVAAHATRAGRVLVGKVTAS